MRNAEAPRRRGDFPLFGRQPPETAPRHSPAKVPAVRRAGKKSRRRIAGPSTLSTQNCRILKARFLSGDGAHRPRFLRGPGAPTGFPRRRCPRGKCRRVFLECFCSFFILFSRTFPRIHCRLRGFHPAAAAMKGCSPQSEHSPLTVPLPPEAGLLCEASGLLPAVHPVLRQAGRERLPPQTSHRTAPAREGRRDVVLAAARTVPTNRALRSLCAFFASDETFRPVHRPAFGGAEAGGREPFVPSQLGSRTPHRGCALFPFRCGIFPCAVHEYLAPALLLPEALTSATARGKQSAGQPRRSLRRRRGASLYLPRNRPVD
jgi:hypothetical protein